MFSFFFRHEKICQKFERFFDKDARILEIGGGIGFVAEKRIQRGGGD